MGKFLDALKNLGNKLNGTTPSSTTTVAVINEIAEDYVAPQAALTFDTVPTTNSTNPVTSGGIKTYVDGLMSGALKRAIVETLPTEDIDTNTIYMVLDATAAQGNVYNEYLYINNAWELIGTTAVAETVIANPTLAGTETALTGLQVGDTKYVVAQTNHLYRHNLIFSGVISASGIVWKFCPIFIETTSSTKIVLNDLKTLGVFVSDNRIAVGYNDSNTNIGYLVGDISANDVVLKVVTGGALTTLTNVAVTDTVTQIF